jgi:hypothetical protein
MELKLKQATDNLRGDLPANAKIIEQGWEDGETGIVIKYVSNIQKQLEDELAKLDGVSQPAVVTEPVKHDEEHVKPVKHHKAK